MIARTLRALPIAAVLALGSAAPGLAQSDQAEGTLTVALAGDIDNFDPATNQLIAFQAALGNTIFDALVSYDADLNLEPRLAQSYEVSPDAKVFTFNLVEGATFHDGTPVNAEAVVASLKRSAELGGIFGIPLQRVTSFDTPDDLTVVLSLEEPYAPFLTALANVPILATGSFENATREPVGSGPFTFESWTPNDRIVLSRNDDYWGDKPSFGELVFRPIPDAQVALTNLYAGEVDIVAEAPTSVIRQVDTNQANIVRPSVSNSIGYIEMSGHSGKLDNVDLRRALAYAFDRETIKAVAFGGQGDSVPSPLPVGSFAYVDLEGYPYDLDKAREALAASGEENVEISLEILTGFPEAEQLGRVWQASLAQIGVTLNLNVSELSVWLDRYVNRDYDMTWNFFGVSPDPHSFFDIIMRPHLEDEYDNPEMLELIDQGIATSVMEERAAIYGELQEMVVDELPVMTIQSRPIAAVARKGIEGFAMNPLGWGLYAGVNISE